MAPVEPETSVHDPGLVDVDPNCFEAELHWLFGESGFPATARMQREGVVGMFSLPDRRMVRRFDLRH